MKKVVTSVRLPPLIFEELKNQSKSRGVNQSELLVELVSNGLAQRNQLLEYVVDADEKVQKTLDEVRSMVIAQIYVAVAQDKDKFNQMLEYSKKFESNQKSK